MGISCVASTSKHTNCDGLDLHAILNVSAVWVVRLLMGQYRLAAEGVDEGGPT